MTTQQQGGTMTQDPRWYAERVRNSIADKLQQKFSSGNATSSEFVEAIRTFSLDDLVRDIQGQGGSGSR